jgi:hypothetical protein
MFDFIILQIWNEYDNKVRTMKRYLVLPMFVLGSIMPLFISTPALAQELHIVKGTWHSMMVETGLSIYKKWNTVILHFTYHRLKIAVI